MSVTTARSVDALVRALADSDPGRPRLTWYGDGEERVELSGRVLANWVAKSGNLLVEEVACDPGTRVRLDLPLHWRTVVLALSVWSVGGEVVRASTDAPAEDVLVTTSPVDHDGAGYEVAVALPALARRFEPAPGAGSFDVDYNAQVAGFADELAYGFPEDAERVLARARSAAASRGWEAGVRVLVTDPDADLVDVVLAALSVDGSLVLVGDPAADVERIAADEQVSARL